MKYRIYEHYVTDLSLLIGVISDNTKVMDAIETCLSIDKNFGARITRLYKSVLESHNLPREIVNILEHDDKLSILELKKKFIRLTFFIDYDGIKFLNDKIQKAIVFLTYFKKEKTKAPKIEIEKAIKLRDMYLSEKLNKTLEIEVVKNG